MTQVKQKHIDRLRRGKKSGIKIGSRGVPHHLFQHEQIHYSKAIENKYLEITDKHRVNLENLWYQICQAYGWKQYVLIKYTSEDRGDIILDGTKVFSGTIKQMKQKIQSLCS